MKKRFFTMTMVAVLAVAFVACNKDDDGSEKIEVNYDDDLVLPSGIIWTKTNVGADNPWNYGSYFAWGEIESKSNYDWKTYKYCIDTCNSFTKYCDTAIFGNNGFIDGLTKLDATDDIATTKLGSDYSIPTVDDWKELCTQCYWVWTSNYDEKNVSGWIVYNALSDNDKGVKVFDGKTSNSSYVPSLAHIFLPAAGYRSDSDLIDAGTDGFYWSSSLKKKSPNAPNAPRFAYSCYFGCSFAIDPEYISNRCNGLTIRPVRRK